MNKTLALWAPIWAPAAVWFLGSGLAYLIDVKLGIILALAGAWVLFMVLIVCAITWGVAISEKYGKD